MNLKSKKARVPIVALAASGLAAGTVGVLATASSGAASLTLLPGATSATITNVDRTGATAATQNAAETAYGLKFGGLSGTDDLLMSVTGTAAGVVQVTQRATNGAPDDGTAPVTATAGGAAAVAGSTPAATDNYYLGSETAGTYTVQFFQDVNGNLTYDAAIDTGAPAFTLTVKDVTGETAASSDDLALDVTAESRIDKGEVVRAKATVEDLTKSDVRGSSGSPSLAVLGKEIQDLLTIGMSAPAVTAAAASAWDGTTYNRTSAAAATGGTVTSTATFGTVVDTASTDVVDNGVTAVAFQNTDTVNVDYPANAGAAAVRTGTSAVTYTVKATNGGGTAVSGAKVFFRVLPDTGGGTPILAADLSTSAGTPDAQGDVGVNTAADGTASVTVTSAKTANLNSYTVAARSNGTAAITIDAQYQTPAVTNVTTGGSTSALVGTSVNLTGKVTDQWKQAISPVGVTALLTYTNAGAGSPTPTSGNFAIGADGTFSATVSEAPANTTASTDSYTWTVGGVVSSAASVDWVKSITPATVTPVSIDTASGTGSGPNSAFPLESTERTGLADHNSLNSATYIATVKDEDGTALKFSNFTISGTPGVMFVDRDGNLQSSLAVRTNNAGQISPNESTAGVEVVFTKSGPATITLNAGGITETVNVTAEAAVEAWKIEVYDTQGDPGDNVTVTGEVTDAFGNPVPGASYDLDIPDAEFGAITTGASGTTNSFGKFNAIFVSGGQDSGIITTRGYIQPIGTPNVAAGTLGGMAVPASQYLDTGKITVKTSAVSLSVEPSRVSAGPIEVSGTASPNATVDIWGKRTGTSAPYTVLETVKADAEGEFGATINVVRSITFYAQMGTVKSEQVSTTVFSQVTLSARALGGGKVELRADGNPNQATKLSFYWVGGNGKLNKIQTLDTNSKGFASMVWSTSKGEKTVRAYYVATGTRTGFAQAQVVNK